MTRASLARGSGACLLAACAAIAACTVDASAPQEGASVATDAEPTPLPRGARRMSRQGDPVPEAKFCSSAPSLKYYGGPVLQNVKVYNVNWGLHVDTNVTTQLPRFYADVVASPYFDWLSEYDTIGLNGQDGLPGSNQGIARGTYAGSVTINPSLCAGTGSPNSCALSDAQVRTEINAQITAGNLPAPTKGCDGLNDTIYMLNFNSSVMVSLSPSLATCVQLCAYHGTGIYQGKHYAYGVMPDFFTGACTAGGCGPGSALQTLTSLAAHELIEAVTDPEVGLAASPTSRPGAWHDTVCGEIGDICEHLYGTINVSGTAWTVQQMWSNTVNDCITTKASLPAVCTAANTPAGCRPCTCANDHRAAAGVPGCGGATPWCETDAANIKRGFCVECTNNAECTSPATCTKSATAATDDTCTVGCVPLTACPSGLDCGVFPDGCAGVLNCGTCAAGMTCTLNHCAASGVDAGTDGATPDAATQSDAAAQSDAATQSDATAPDAASSNDASFPDAGHVVVDASPPQDGSTPADSGGCGCRVAQGRGERSPAEMLAMGGLGLLAAVRLRRRAARR